MSAKKVRTCSEGRGKKHQCGGDCPGGKDPRSHRLKNQRSGGVPALSRKRRLGLLRHWGSGKHEGKFTKRDVQGFPEGRSVIRGDLKKAGTGKGTRTT